MASFFIQFALAMSVVIFTILRLFLVPLVALQSALLRRLASAKGVAFKDALLSAETNCETLVRKNDPMTGILPTVARTYAPLMRELNEADDLVGKLSEAFKAIEADERPHEIAETKTPEEQAPSEDVEQHSLRENSLPRLKVLVAEDVAANRHDVRLMLEAMGHRIIEAENGAQAISAAENSQPDVILMDMSMPVMDGLSATRAIRGHRNLDIASIPIVAISNHGVDGHYEDAEADGLSYFLTKPFDRPALAEALHAAMVGQAFKPSDLPGQEVSEALPVLDPSILHEDGSHWGVEKIEEMIDQFLAESTLISQAIHDAPDAQIRSHKAQELKGIANNLGLLELADIARQIELGEEPMALERAIRAAQKALRGFKLSHL